ncbi:MAG: hypothetical protein U0169_14015 [Polyangiaceae bacterium]
MTSLRTRFGVAALVALAAFSAFARTASADDGTKADGGAAVVTESDASAAARAAPQDPAVATMPTSAPPAVAPAAVPAADPASAPVLGTPPWVVIHGYVQPAFGFRYRPAAVPRDQWAYGALASRAGLLFSGERFTHWKYMVHFALDANLVRVVSGLDVDRDATGAIRDVRTANRDVVGVALEEVSITYEPWSWLALKGGQLRIPFNVGHRSANFSLMFPQRAGPNEVFLSGADRGGLATVDVGKGIFTGSVGVFDGTSLTLFRDSASTRGLLYSARVDVNPFGALAPTESDLGHGPLRVGLGFGVLYRPATVFDRTGYEAIDTNDTRIAASIRASFRGLYVQAELMKRQFTDSLSARPTRATGVYAQASYFARLGRGLALAPIARVGESVLDETTLPRKVVFLEGGLSFFPMADGAQPDALRITAQYQGERRITEREDAHGALVQLQYLF